MHVKLQSYVPLTNESLFVKHHLEKRKLPPIDFIIGSDVTKSIVFNENLIYNAKFSLLCEKYILDTIFLINVSIKCILSI